MLRISRVSSDLEGKSEVDSGVGREQLYTKIIVKMIHNVQKPAVTHGRNNSLNVDCNMTPEVLLSFAKCSL